MKTDIISRCLFTDSPVTTYYSDDLLDLQSSDLFIAEILYYNSDWLWAILYGGYSVLKYFGNWFILSATEEYQFAAFVDIYYLFITKLADGSYNIIRGNFNETNFSKR